MADLVKKIRTNSGDLQIDYNALANLPKYAASSSAGGAATSVAKSLTVKINGGTTEGTDLFTFNGSAAKNINLTTQNMYGIIDGGIASVKEKASSGNRYAKIADIQCTGYYHRICQNLLLTSRVESILLTIVVYSDESDKFTGHSVSYVQLTPTCAGIVDHLHAGLVDVSSDRNRFELWYHQGQWGQSLNITPLSRNEENMVLNFYSYNETSGGSSSSPVFNTTIPITKV